MLNGVVIEDEFVQTSKLWKGVGRTLSVRLWACSCISDDF